MNYRTNEDKLGCRDRFNGYNRIHSIEAVELSDVEPVTLAEVKDHLRLTFDADDAYLGLLIKSSRHAIEQFTALSLVPKNITATLDNYEGWELPYGPVVDVPGVPEQIEEGVIMVPATDPIVPVVTLDGETVDATFFGSSFRKLASPFGTVTITYRAGYETCPPDLKLAILHEIAYQYENRGDVSNQERLSPIAKGFAQKHRRVPKVL